MHRGRLQMLLLAAVRERLGPDSVRTGPLFQGFEQCAGGVRAHFLDRSSGRPVVGDADVLVGADGIDSVVRRRLYPDERLPQGNGVHMWRRTAPARPRRPFDRGGRGHPRRPARSSSPTRSRTPRPRPAMPW
ncbi:FAD-dependent monooxygenase [Kitasatospora sp. NPDC058218]|uniref:FAD-dependent monooxygenase n=1 Tax=Kitasatospora sp. NPDC058218 TaxID=3346385 RepID=UPI0036DDD2FB